MTWNLVPILKYKSKSIERSTESPLPVLNRILCLFSFRQGGENNVRLISSELIGGVTMLTFRRPLAASDEYDKAILPNTTQAVFWAIGPVNQTGETSHDRSNRIIADVFLTFGRSPQWNCSTPSGIF